MSEFFPEWSTVHTIVFDFDGVFTNNKVWVDQDGKESVRCDRGDGLAFDILRRFVVQHNWELDYFILSKEKNPVVTSRARKLKVSCVQNISNKAVFLKDYLARNQKTERGLVYIGNDLNDLAAMRLSGFSIAPSDAHQFIQEQANLTLNQRGGEGFVREFIEKLLGIDKMSIDEVAQLF